MEPETAMVTGDAFLLEVGIRPATLPVASMQAARASPCGDGTRADSTLVDQLKLSPQAHDPVAFGLSIVKPCFSMVSTKSIDAPCT